MHARQNSHTITACLRCLKKTPPTEHSSLLLGKLGALTLEVNYRATTTGDDAPRAPQFGFDGLHEREPGEHTRGDIRAPGRLPRQVTPRGAHARRPPTARRIGTHRGGRIQFFRSRSNASADRPSRLTRSPTIHPTHARRVRSSRTSCTSSCDSPPRSAWTAFPTVRTRPTRLNQTNTMPPRE